MTAPTPDAALTEEQVAEWRASAEATQQYAPETARRILALAADRARLTERLAEVMAELTDARERAGRFARDATLADDRCDRLEALANRHYARAEKAESEQEYTYGIARKAHARAEAAEARETALREAVEALAEECATALASAPDRGWDSDWDRGYAAAVRFVKQRLGRMTAEHATPSDAPQGEQHEPPCCCHKEMENGVGCCYCEGEGPCNHDDPAPASADTGLSEGAFVSGYCENGACERCVQGPEFNLDGRMLVDECTHDCHGLGPVPATPPCPKCRAQFDSRRGLAQHARRAHGIVRARDLDTLLAEQVRAAGTEHEQGEEGGR